MKSNNNTSFQILAKCNKWFEFINFINPFNKEPENFFYFSFDLSSELIIWYNRLENNIINFIYRDLRNPDKVGEVILLRKIYNLKDKSYKFEFNESFIKQRISSLAKTKNFKQFVIWNKTKKGWSIYANGIRDSKFFLEDSMVSYLKEKIFEAIRYYNVDKYHNLASSKNTLIEYIYAFWNNLKEEKEEDVKIENKSKKDEIKEYTNSENDIKIF